MTNHQNRSPKEKFVDITDRFGHTLDMEEKERYVVVYAKDDNEANQLRRKIYGFLNPDYCPKCFIEKKVYFMENEVGANCGSYYKCHKCGECNPR